MHKLYFKDDGVYLDDLRLKGVKDLKIDSGLHKASTLKLEICVDVNGLDSADFNYQFKI